MQIHRVCSTSESVRKDRKVPVILNPDTYPWLYGNSPRTLTVDERHHMLTVNNPAAITEREREGQMYTLPYLLAPGFDFEAKFHQVNQGEDE